MYILSYDTYICLYLCISVIKNIILFVVHICKGVPFTNRGCLKLTLGYNNDCEITVSKGTCVCVCVCVCARVCVRVCVCVCVVCDWICQNPVDL